MRKFAQVQPLRPQFDLKACRGLDSVQIWKAFASTYPVEGDLSLKHRHKQIKKPNMSMSDYLKPVQCSRYQWIVFLSLSPSTCSRSDLVQISQLPNLGALMVDQNRTADGMCFDDSIIRTWARLAATSSAFCMLRVLVIRLQREITGRMFEYLQDFPSLIYLIVENMMLGQRLDIGGLCDGWDRRRGLPQSDLPAQSDSPDNSWDAVMRACFTLGDSKCRTTLPIGLEATDALPTLHLSLGECSRAIKMSPFQGFRLESFIRSTEALPVQAHPNDGHGKRPLPIDHTTDVNKASKKPVIRASKQQKMEDVLTGLHH